MSFVRCESHDAMFGYRCQLRADHVINESPKRHWATTKKNGVVQWHDREALPPPPKKGRAK